VLLVEKKRRWVAAALERKEGRRPYLSKGERVHPFSIFVKGERGCLTVPENASTERKGRKVP